MSHLSITAQGVLAVALILILLAALRSRFLRADEKLTAPTAPGMPPPAPSPARRRTVRASAVLLTLLLSLSHVGAISFLTHFLFSSAHLGPRHEITFRPGQYRRVVLSSGEPVAAAMRAVYEASDGPARSAAIEHVQRLVNAGDAEAAFRLGRFYHLESPEPDYPKALQYYQIAHDRHHAWATNNLGLLYQDGLGVPRDEKKAHGYFLEAARQNNPWAYVNLADLAFDGPGAPTNASRGIAWLEAGALKNCTLCLIEEAAIYHSGAYGIRVDRHRTVALLNKAAALGDPEADLIIAELHIVGDGVAQSSMSSLAILKTLSEDGAGEASNLLAELSSDDKIRNYLFQTALGGIHQMPSDFTRAFPQDPRRSMRYWTRATRQGNCQAWIDLSSVFDRGINVRADHRRAARYVEQATRCDPVNSFYLWKLAVRYYDANGVSRDCEAAERFFRASVDHGYTDAMADLGYIYDKGCAPVPEDDRRAFRIYLLCAKLGVALCQNNVGAMIKHGRGVRAADPARGYGWIKLAALHGNRLAEANLEDRLFTPSVRAAGLVDLADIQRRLLSDPRDPQAIRRDPWY